MPRNDVRIVMSAEDKTKAAFDNLERKLGGLKSSAASLGLTLGGAFTVRGIANIADQMVSIQARLKLASRSMVEFNAANEDLVRIANSARTPLAETATLYTRIASSLKDTAASQDQMAGLTEAVALSLKLSGATAEEASSAMLQFSQAVASGVLRGEEFNAVNEAAPRLMQALASSIGVTVGSLRDMAKEGQLTRELLIGIINELPKLRDEAQSIPRTIGDAFTSLSNKVSLAISDLDKYTGASASTSEAIFRAGSTAMEAVMVLGANIAFVFSGIGREIGGIAAQIAALFRLDFKGFSAIGDAMKRDAARARKELDEFERKILSENQPRIARALEKTFTIQQPVIKQRAAKKSKAGKSIAEVMADLDYDIAGNNLRMLTQDIEDNQRALDKMNADLERSADYWRNVADPMLKYQEMLQEIQNLEQRGRLTSEQAGSARTYVFKRQADELENLAGKGKDDLADLQRAVEGWSRSAADSIVDFAMKGKGSFKDMANSIVADLMRMAVQKLFTDKLFKSVESYLPMIASAFGFANGGVMTSAGPMPLKTYASGGIASSPQVAIYGEGSRPEAYVPLPDGRSIPVTMRGAGAVVNVNVINNGNAQVRTESRQDGNATTLDIIVEQVEGAMGRRMMRGSGLAGPLEARYGLNPAAGAQR